MSLFGISLIAPVELDGRASGDNGSVEFKKRYRNLREALAAVSRFLPNGQANLSISITAEGCDPLYLFRHTGQSQIFADQGNWYPLETVLELFHQAESELLASRTLKRPRDWA